MKLIVKRLTATLLAAALLAGCLPLTALAAPAEETTPGTVSVIPPAEEEPTPEAATPETATGETALFDAGVPALMMLSDEGAPAALAEIADISPEGIPGYNFNWADDGDTRDAGPEICYYTDAYFKNPATTYNPSLAGASMCLTMASFGSVELGSPKKLELQSQNAKKLLKDLGFQSPEDNPEFRVAPTTDSIGCVVAYKIVKDANGGNIPLIAVGVRGSNYKSEWASNVTIGAAGNHDGFENAAEQVLAFVKTYLDKHAAELAGYESVKFWVTGFSRAAATSNLTAALLNQDLQDNPHHTTRIGKKINSVDDIYAYTFEAPAGALSGVNDTRDYSNIFNIINPQDLVPMVAPVSLDFRRYGVDKFLPAKESHPDYAALNAAMQKQAAAHNRSIAFELLERMMIYPDTTRYDIYSAVYPAQSLFFADFVANLAEDGVGTREAFIDSDSDGNSLQSALRDLMGTFMKDDTVPMSEFGSMFKGMLQWKYANQVGSLLKKLANGDKSAAYVKLREWMVAGAQDKGAVHINAALIDSLSTDLMSTLGLFGRMLGGNAFMLPSLVTNEMIAMKLVSNNGSEHVGTGHSVALCKAWLEMMDPNYTNTAKTPDEVFTTGEYRRISLSRAYIGDYGASGDDAEEPMTVTVTDTATGDTWNFTDDGLLGEGEISAGAPGMMTFGTDGSSCMSVVYLPCSRAYTIEAWQTHRLDNSAVSIKLEEFNPALPKGRHIGQIKRQVVWYNHPGTNTFGARKYVITVPAYAAADIGSTEGSSCAYTVDRYNINSGKHEALAPTRDEKRGQLLTLSADAAQFVNLDIVVTPNLACGTAGELGETMHLVPTDADTGDQAYLCAVPAEGYRFAGWYFDGTLLSEEAEFTYAITGQELAGAPQLEARFAEVSTPTPAPQTDPNAVPAATAAPVAPVEPATDSGVTRTAGKIPQTADAAPLALWAALCGFSLAGAAALHKRRRGR